MRDRRRGKIGLVVGVMVLVGAIVVPGTVAQSDPVRTEVGVLRLHLDSDGKYFRFDTPTTPIGALQSINGSCPVTSLSGPQWVDLTAGTTSFTLSRVGLSNNGLGVRFLNCGRVDAPNWALRIKLGSAIDGPGLGVDLAELDLQGWGNVTAVADLYLDGTKVDSVTQFISGNGTRSRMVIDRTGKSLFDEIRLRPRDAFDSVALRGGGTGSPLPGTLGSSLVTNDTLFRVVSESNLSVQKTPVETPISVGDDAAFDITVTNGGAGTVSNIGVSDTFPAGLTWSIASQTGSACSIADGELTCTIPDLAGDASYSVRVTATTSAPGEVVNPLVTVTVNDTTVATAGPAEVEVLGAALSVTKTADATNVVVPDPIGYTITVTNTGPGDAKGVTVTDEVPTSEGLDWTIDSQPGDDCSLDGDPVTLTCDIGTLGATDYTVHITSPTTTDSAGTISNTASVEASNVTPDPASAEASITVFAGTLDCNEAAEPQGGGANPLSELVRLDNVGGGCGDLIPFTLESGPGVAPGCDDLSPQCILLTKDLLGQNAQFFWTVTWAPETGDYMETETEFDFDLDGNFTILQLCLADADDDGFPELPGSDPWCLVDTSTELQIDTGLVIVTERYYGAGDPGGKRH